MSKNAACRWPGDCPICGLGVLAPIGGAVFCDHCRTTWLGAGAYRDLADNYAESGDPGSPEFRPIRSQAPTNPAVPDDDEPIPF